MGLAELPLLPVRRLLLEELHRIAALRGVAVEAGVEGPEIGAQRFGQGEVGGVVGAGAVEGAGDLDGPGAVVEPVVGQGKCPDLVPDVGHLIARQGAGANRASQAAGELVERQLGQVEVLAGVQPVEQRGADQVGPRIVDRDRDQQAGVEDDGQRSPLPLGLELGPAFSHQFHGVDPRQRPP